MSKFDRAPKRKPRVGKREALIATGVAAVGAAWLASQDGKKPDAPVPEGPKTTQPHRPDSGMRRRSTETGISSDPLDNENPDISGEDLERAREHAAFKQRIADQLAELLPGYSVMWTTAVNDQAQYNEFLDILGPDGNRLGDVYPDETDGSLRFNPNEDMARVYSDAIGTSLAPFEATDANDIADAVHDMEQLAGYEAKWSDLQQAWSGEEKFVTGDDGSLHLNPEYVEEETSLKLQMAAAAHESSTVTTFAEQEERAQEDAEQSQSDTGE